MKMFVDFARSKRDPQVIEVDVVTRAGDTYGNGFLDMYPGQVFFGYPYEQYVQWIEEGKHHLTQEELNQYRNK